MDLYANETNQIKMYGQMRYEQANNHNMQVSAMRRQAATQILSAKAKTKDEISQEETEGSAVGGGASISTAIDANSAKNAVKTHLKNKAEKAVKNQAKQSIDSVATKLKDPHGVPHDTRTMNPLTDTAAENEKMALRASKAGMKEKLENKVVGKMASKTGARVLGAAGGFMNIGMGLKDFHDDMKGGTFHLDGANDMEKASNALQMASAVADVGGIYFAPLLAVGMLMGAASSVVGAIGEDEELTATEAAQKVELADETNKIRGAVGKLRTVDPNKVRAQAMASITRTSSKPKGQQQRTTAKVSS